MIAEKLFITIKEKEKEQEGKQKKVDCNLTFELLYIFAQHYKKIIVHVQEYRK